MTKKFLGITALILLGLALGFTALEVIFRLQEPKSVSWYRSHPLLGWFHKPGQSGIYSPEKFKTPVKINSQGLRDVELSPEKPAGVYRVIVLGDSFMEAFQVPLEDSFPKQLEKMLQKDHRDKKFEVINFSCSGFGTDQEYLMLKHLGLAYQPDLVILAFCLSNDFWDNYFKKNKKRKPAFALSVEGKLVSQPSFESLTPMEALRKKSRVISKLFHQLEQNDKTYKLLLKLDLASFESRQREIYNTAYSPDWEKACDLTFVLVKETKELAEKNGSKFLLLSVTDAVLFQDESSREKMLSQGIDVERPTRLLQNFCRRQQISYVPLVYPFRELMAQRHLQVNDIHIADDGHWTALGHQLAATVIKQKMEQEFGPEL